MTTEQKADGPVPESQPQDETVASARPSSSSAGRGRSWARAFFRPIPLIVTAWIIGLAAYTFWPAETDSESKWWLAPPLTYIDELLLTVEEAAREGMTGREQITFILPEGTLLPSNTSTVFSFARGQFRDDTYADGKLQESDWINDRGNEITKTSVQLKSKTFQVVKSAEQSNDSTRVARLYSIIDLLDQASRNAEPVEIDGKQVIGFHIEPLKDASTDQLNCRIWFDTVTRLPLRVEIDISPSSDVSPDSERLRILMTWDDFHWRANLPDETFAPKIPAGFVEAAKK